MFLEQQTVILSMALYFVIATLIPRIIKRPTGIGLVDDLVMSLIAQEGSLISGAILTGLVVFATNYVQAEFM
jgi:hypothetical protein